MRNRVKRVKLRTLVPHPTRTSLPREVQHSNWGGGGTFLRGGGGVLTGVFAKAVEEGLNLAHGGQMPVFTTFEWRGWIPEVFYTSTTTLKDIWSMNRISLVLSELRAKLPCNLRSCRRVGGMRRAVAASGWSPSLCYYSFFSPLSGQDWERRWALRMGLCLGTELTEEKKARIRSAKIDRDLYEFAKMEMNVVKILLLGETGNVWRPVWVAWARVCTCHSCGDVWRCSNPVFWW